MQLTARHQRNVRPTVRFASAESSAVTLPTQWLAPSPAQPLPFRADLPSHLAPVRKNARVFVLIINCAIMTRNYGGYRVANSICDSSYSEPKPPRAANCCIVACRYHSRNRLEIHATS